MSHAPFDACPSPTTLQRIAAARWTPYVADTLQTWCRNALQAPGACANQRAGDCDACAALHKIAAMRWSENLGERIQQAARDALGLPNFRAARNARPVRAMV